MTRTSHTNMVPITTVLLLHSACMKSCGSVLGTEARSHIMDKRWRVEGEHPYEWVLQSRSSSPGSPFKLKIFMEGGVELTRNARCPLFLANYVSLDSPNLMGVDEVFRDNTIYHLEDGECWMQNTWFTGPRETREYGPYFLNKQMPLMKSIRVRWTPKPQRSNFGNCFIMRINKAYACVAQKYVSN